MAFVKLATRPKAYYKRFQVQFRRRREGKTDYTARRALVYQDRNKYNNPKYRLVVRLTDHFIICQIACAQLNGDRIVAAANSSELPRYGVLNGFKNYSAAYCTGLLVGRRLLKKWEIDSLFKANLKVGEESHVKEAEDRHPVRCILDVGLRPTTTGSRVFGAMKGAADAGLAIPYKALRFPGFSKGKYNPAKHQERIVGKHIADYMTLLSEKDPESYKRIFSLYIKKGIKAGDVVKMYTEAHKKIIADPAAKPKRAFTADENCRKFAHSPKISSYARKANVVRKLKAIHEMNEE